MNSYSSLCDDFGVSTYLHGKLEMPTGRETVLHFFEAVQKAAPKMTEFEKRSDGEYIQTPTINPINAANVASPEVHTTTRVHMRPSFLSGVKYSQ